MKKFFSLFAVLLFAVSAMAIDWSGIGYTGSAVNGYGNKYKTSLPAGVSVVNIQQPGFATAPGFYITFPDAAFGEVRMNGSRMSYDVQGAGICLHVSNFTALETEVQVMNSGNTEARWTFYVYYEDGVSSVPFTICKDLYGASEDHGSPALFTFSTDGTGAVVINIEAIAGEEALTCFRGNNGLKLADFKVNNEAASAYFEHSMSVDKKTIALTPIAEIPANAIISFKGTAEYRTAANADAWPSLTFKYTYGAINPDMTGTTVTNLVPADASMAIELTETTTASTTFSTNSDADIRVLSVDPSVATVAVNGNTITVTGKKIGTTTVDIYQKANATYAMALTSITINVTKNVPDHPATAAPVPTREKAMVLAVYSDTYTPVVAANFSKNSWSGVSYTAMDADGDNYLRYNTSTARWIAWGDTGGNNAIRANDGYTGSGTGLDASAMQFVHYDIWSSADCNTVSFTLRDTQIKNNVSVRANQWTSVDIDITEIDAAILNNVQWMKIEGFNTCDYVALDNVYFYTTSLSADVTAPVMTSATLVANSAVMVGAQLSVAATDEVGVVKFRVADSANGFAYEQEAVDGTNTLTLSGLRPGVTYNFSITAVDAARNESEPMLVSNVVPSIVAAPVPAHNAALVMSLYSDEYSDAPASFVGRNEGWWNAPQMAEVSLSADDHALLYYGANVGNGMIGWQYAEFDATGFDKFHVDVYVAKAGQMKFGPTYGGEGLETAVYNQAGIKNLVPGWNSIELDLAGKDLSNMFQMQFTDYGASNFGSFIVDNVYFYKEGYTREVTAGDFGTICLAKAATLEGATAYEIVGATATSISLAEVIELEAGVPYIFQATADELVATLSGEAVAVAGSANGLVGTFAAIVGVEGEENVLTNNYILSNNTVKRCGTGCSIAANRAYINLGAIENQSTSAPIRVIAIVEGTDVVTALENANAENVVKMVVNGQLIIIKNGVRYNALGQVVK